MIADAPVLERRRLASEGGPYTLVLEPEPSRRAGTLSGTTLAVKDLIDVAGTPTRAGSAAFADAQPAAADAPVVAVLRDAGAVVVGKTALHEIAFGTTGINPYEGTPRNPRDRSRICGGSSSGSAAAVAEGSASLALGTDTGGSVRIPAALCGVVGFKPSYGRLDTDGMLPLAKSLDHIGLIAREVAGVASAFGVLAHTANGAPTPLRRIGVAKDALESASEEVARGFEHVLRSLAGIELEEVVLADAELVMAASTAILFFEAAAQHAARVRREPSRYGSDVQERLVLGCALRPETYAAARAAAIEIRSHVVGLLRDYDVLLTPTVPVVAPRVEEANGNAALPALLVEHTRLANLTGLPALSLPVPVDGLPVGLQILGTSDESVLAAAAGIERRLVVTP